MTTELQSKFERVMIIDDGSIDLYVSSRIIKLNHFGKKLLMYSEATEALNYLQDNQENVEELPQVIFLDIYMPEMSGFGFMAIYNKFSATLKNYCKVFVVSSSADEGDIARVYNDKNIIGFHEKPITKKFLEDIL